MINIYSDRMSGWPASVVLAPTLNRLTPSFAQIWDYERISPASGVGATVKSIQGAIGEYFERRHFFNEVSTVSKKTLHEMMPSLSADAFLSALRQTSSASTEQLRNHRFSTVRAFNAFTLEQVEIPAVLVALDNISVCHDLDFYPCRDTCGCSCHTGLHQSIQGAVGELMERQSLLLYWLTGQASYELIPDSMTGVNYIDELIANLVSEGELRILDVTLPGAPGYAILTLYGARNEHSTIKYSTGLSYAPDRESALNKSLVELWQSYICMHNFIIGDYRREDIIDRYQRHFMSCNTYATYAELCQSTQYRKAPLKLSGIRGEKCDTGSLMDFLESITRNLFIYCSGERISDGCLWHTKVLSPDLFLHMDNSGPLNTDNKLYHPGQGIVVREKVMVPFP